MSEKRDQLQSWAESLGIRPETYPENDGLWLRDVPQSLQGTPELEALVEQCYEHNVRALKQQREHVMSKEARNLLIKSLLFLFLLCFVVGIIGSIIRKLDLSSTLMLAGTFAIGSLLLTWLTIWEDRRTRSSEIDIAARLAPHGLVIHKSKDEYAVLDDQIHAVDVILAEGLSLDELEAFVDGLVQGIERERTCQYNEEIEARRGLLIKDFTPLVRPSWQTIEHERTRFERDRWPV